MRNTPRRALAALLVLLTALPVVPRPAAAQAPRPQASSVPGIADPELFAKSLQVAQEVMAQYGSWDNPAELARINRIGYELAQQSDFQKYPFTFSLIDMPVPNAFALPAGQIFVTRGLLDLDLDDDMLAAVIGHEIGHVTLEHYKRMQRKSTVLNVLSNLLMVGVMVGASNDRREPSNIPYDPRVGRDQGGDVIQGAAAASLIIGELLLRSYSRDHEDESDQEGQRLASAAGYDPIGAQKVWQAMNNRAPRIREYGYWQTHPFPEERARAAEARKVSWKIQPRKPVDAYRQRTQATLMTWLERSRPKPGEKDAAAYIKEASLATWPQGKVAENLRLERLHELRDTELTKPLLSRDYGAVVRGYREEVAAVRAIDPKSDLLPALDGEIADLEKQRREVLPRALEVLDGGVYETSFLESFLSNFPDAAQAPEVGLALGDAHSRLGNQTEAVSRYLTTWEAAPQSPEGKRAQAGLRNLAPSLKELAALQQLVLQDRDPEIKKMAADRLSAVVKNYDDLTNGAEYLRRYPEGQHAPLVLDRLNILADNLYAEVVLYQGMGDAVKAMDRINKILTHAPLSPAAEKLRDRVLLGEEKAG
ncbi:MAG TPA: M48 family metalloprotease [Thermoanaerobaculia bacterium]|nr:M48 family metalloprotease [Thermoanaerobaculia bacterium]